MVTARLSAQISATDNASKVFLSAGKAAETMGDSVERAGKEGAAGLDQLGDSGTRNAAALQTLGTSLATFGAAGTAAFGFAVNASNQFESAMANVNSIAGLTEAELTSLGGSVRELAVELGQKPTGLAEGLYDIQSSGFEAADALSILETATVAAGAGLTQTEVSAKAITSVLNAYGQGAEEAGNVSDLLFKTVDSGVITFEQLATNMGSVLPAASALQIPLEQLTAAYAEMTLQGISATQAETGIAALMRSAIAPTTAMKDAISEYGYASAEALIQSQGLAGYLDFLAEASGGTTAGLTALIGSTEGTTAALALTRNEGANYAAMLGDMSTAASDGAYTQGVFAVQMDTTAGSLQRLGASANEFKLTMGDALQPLVQFGAEGLTGVVSRLNALPAPIQTTIAGLGLLGSGVALASGALMLALPKIVEFRSALTTLGGARGIAASAGSMLGRITTVVNPLTLGLAVLGTVGYKAWESFREGQDAAQSLVDVLDLMRGSVQDLQLSGLNEEAGQLDQFISQIEQVTALAPGLQDAMLAGFGDQARFHIEEVKDAYSLSTEEAQRFEEAQRGINQAFTDSRVDQDALSAYLTNLSTQYAQGAINLDQYVDGVVWANENIGTFSEANTEAAAAVGTMDRQVVAVINGVNIYGEAAGATSDQLERMGETARAVGTGMASAMVEASAAATEAVAAYAERLAELQEIASSVMGTDTFAEQWNVAGLGSDLNQVAVDATHAGEALGNVFRVVVGNTDAIASQSQSVADWANELIGVKGEYAIIDDLLSNGVITLQTYNAAQQAQIDITTANAAIQEHVQSIQAQQAPLIAEHTSALERQMGVIANMPAEQQLVALGWMDVNTATRANEVLTMAAAAANGELGESGRRATEQMIAGAAAADPVLAALLEDMGLIEQGADGKITVTLDGAESAMSDLDRLNGTIGDLIDILDNGKLDGSYSIKLDFDLSVAGSSIVGGAQGALDAALGQNLGFQDPIEVEVPVEVKPDLGDFFAPGEDDRGLIGQIRHMMSVTRFEVAYGVDVVPEFEVGEGAASGARSALEAALGGGGGSGVVVDVPVEVRPEFTVGEGVAGGAQGALDAVLGQLGGGSGVTIPINAEDNASPTLGFVGAQAGALDGQQSTLNVDANDNASPVISAARGALGAANGASALMRMLASDGASPVIGAARGALAAVNGASAMVSVNGTNAVALGAVAGARGALGGINGASAMISVNGTNAAALGAVSGARGALNGISGASASISVNGNNAGAMAAIGAVAAYNGVVLATSYINIVTRRIGGSVGGGGAAALNALGNRHGGIAGFVAGGIPAELAEAGPEVLHFARGGTAMIADRGIYDVPPNTYVSPANATQSGMETLARDVRIAGNALGSFALELRDAQQAIIYDLAMFNGDNTPKPIVDVVNQLRDLGSLERGDVPELRELSRDLKAYMGDNTPRPIVDEAFAIDALADRLMRTVAPPPVRPDGWTLAEDGSYVNPNFYDRRKEPSRRAASDDRPVNPREGDIHVSVIVQGSVLTDDDLTEKVSGKLAPIIREAARERERGQGVYHG